MMLFRNSPNNKQSPEERYFVELERVRFSKIEDAKSRQQEGKSIEAANALDDIALRDFLKHYEEIQVLHNDPDKIALNNRISKRLEELGIPEIKDFQRLYDKIQLAAARDSIKLAKKEENPDVRKFRLEQARRNLSVTFGNEAKAKAKRLIPVVDRAIESARTRILVAN